MLSSVSRAPDRLCSYNPFHCLNQLCGLCVGRNSRFKFTFCIVSVVLKAKMTRITSTYDFEELLTRGHAFISVAGIGNKMYLLCAISTNAVQQPKYFLSQNLPRHYHRVRLINLLCVTTLVTYRQQATDRPKAATGGPQWPSGGPLWYDATVDFSGQHENNLIRFILTQTSQ